MVIDLTNVLTGSERVLNKEIPFPMATIAMEGRNYRVLEASDVHVHIVGVSERELLIEGHAELTIELVCDRCLEPVNRDFSLSFSHPISLDDKDAVHNEDMHEANYVDGYKLDVDRLLFNEILVGWPSKVLCKEDCKGLCNTCGQNLNEGTCDCEDTGLDPRMSVIRDLFNKNKEV